MSRPVSNALFYDATLTQAGIDYCISQGKRWRGVPMSCKGDNPEQALRDLNAAVGRVGLTFLPEHVVLS